MGRLCRLVLRLIGLGFLAGMVTGRWRGRSHSSHRPWLSEEDRLRVRERAAGTLEELAHALRRTPEGKTPPSSEPPQA